MAYEGSWNHPATSPRIRQPNAGMYGASIDNDKPDNEPPGSAGMYQQAQDAPLTFQNPLSFANLQAGGTNEVTSGDTSIRSAGPDQTGMYNAYTDLLGTGLQTQAQRDVATINNALGHRKQAFTEFSVFPYLQQFLAQNGPGGNGGSSLNSQLTSSVLRATSPEREQAALDAADADAARMAASGQQQSLNQVAGSGWSPGSPVGIAADLAARQAALQAGQRAKRDVRDQFAQQRTTNLASALNANSQQINPVYSLLASLMS